MAVTYGSTDCDASGSFTSITTTGTGATEFDATKKQEGTACFATAVTSGAGTAYGIKNLDTDITVGDYFTAYTWLWFAGDVPSGGAPFPPPTMTGRLDCFAIQATGVAKKIVLQMLDSTGASGNYEWRINSTTGGDVQVFDPGWTRNLMRRLKICAYIDNSAGWVQIWEGGIKWAEITGIDTYPAADYDIILPGIYWREDTDTEVCFAFDDVIVNDDASPVLPGTVKPWWYYQRNKMRRVS